MTKKLKNVILSVFSISMLLFPTVASAATFGTSTYGASTEEYGQIYYRGSAWNYRGSPYASVSAKYTRDGKTLDFVRVYGGKGYISAWDTLVWNAPKTRFNYNYHNN